MSRPTGRGVASMILVVSALLAGVVGLAVAPAEAQEWKIYMLGKTEPIVAYEYIEVAPFVFFRDDQSMYVFAVGCNRIARIERGGAPLPLPACPVEKLPTSGPRVFFSIMDLEAKRLDDSIAKLRDQIRAYAAAAVGADVAAATPDAEGRVRRIDPAAVQRNLEAIAFLASQINDSLFEIRLSDQRVGKLLEAARSFPRGEKQRYYFSSR